MKKYSYLIYLLLFFSIFRSFLIPLVGVTYASLAAGFINILLAGFIAFWVKDTFYLFIIKVFSILMLLPTFFSALPLWKICAGYLETISPYIILTGATNIRFLRKIEISIKDFENIILIFISILLLGHFLSLIGFELPSLSSVPISTWGAESIDTQIVEKIKGRVSSFVGSSGPYSMSIAYLFIAYAILNSSNKAKIIFLGLIVQILSFSRSGFVLLLVYLFFEYLPKTMEYISASKIKLSFKSFFGYLITLFVFFVIIFIYKDILVFQVERIFYLFTFSNDVSNSVRFDRMNMAFEYINKNIFSLILGSGTGITARVAGGEQFESQIFKIIVEWGLLGISIVILWLNKTISLSKNLKIEDLSLLATFLVNLIVIQAFTSAPIISSMGIALIAKTLKKHNTSIANSY
tara:strand:- start:3041 stop:4261 length:1221 start_codon:yes stop_codon:yes gene_type:complete